MTPNLTRAHLFLSGTVQGVGMRFYIRSLASKHALAGFVRNLPDGRVESTLEGSQGAIQKAIQEIKQGEYADYVKNIECNWEEITSTLGDFEILP